MFRIIFSEKLNCFFLKRRKEKKEKKGTIVKMIRLKYWKKKERNCSTNKACFSV